MQTVFDVVDNSHQNEHACDDGSYYYPDADLPCDWQPRRWCQPRWVGGHAGRLLSALARYRSFVSVRACRRDQHPHHGAGVLALVLTLGQKLRAHIKDHVAGLLAHIPSTSHNPSVGRVMPAMFAVARP